MGRDTANRDTKEMTMLTLNLKTVASAFAALAVTLVLSWTFVDATKLARVQRDQAFSGTISALVR
jgi:hypothetical protein